MGVWMGEDSSSTQELWKEIRKLRERVSELERKAKGAQKHDPHSH